jgi:RimJ/RimL family protein N-acetyltransferase
MDVATDYVAPAYHGQGIMTDAVRTIMTKWAIPRMNARKITASTFAGNIGSQRVFEKNGFKHIVTLPDYVNVRGNIKTLEIFGWTG